MNIGCWDVNLVPNPPIDHPDSHTCLLIILQMYVGYGMVQVLNETKVGNERLI